MLLPPALLLAIMLLPLALVLLAAWLLADGPLLVAALLVSYAAAACGTSGEACIGKPSHR